MKPIFWGSFIGILLGGIISVSGSVTVVSCSNNNDSGSDGDADSDSDADADGGPDASTTADCNAELDPCCDGETCGGGLDPMVQYDGSCQCQRPCTFETCTAGNEDGYCMELYPAEHVAGCHNLIDLPVKNPVTNDCTVGDVNCISDSGASSGTVCIPMPLMTGETLSRCIVTCTTPPTGCNPWTTTCFPLVVMDGSDVAFDFTDSHCVANPAK